MSSIWWAVTIPAVVFLTIWVTMWFCKNLWESNSHWENQDFRQVVDRYEKMVATLTAETRTATLIPQIVEALNLNTKSIDLLEKSTNQLILRSVGFQDKTRRQTQVGEEATLTSLPGRTVLTPTPTTRTESGEEGFVDQTTGKVVPLKEPTAREIAAMPPT